jgi:hypothetical protein
MEKFKRCERCRYSHPFMGKNHDEYHCVSDGWEDDKVKTITEDVCEGCEKYSSKYIEYPLTIQGIDNHFNKKGLTSLHDCGKLVRVSPCGEEYKGKTYLGILLGDLPIGAHVSFNRESEKLGVYPHTNPGIFVPELRKIIYGCESWWGEIENPEDLKDITKEEIDNTWYVQLLKEMVQKGDGKDDE